VPKIVERLIACRIEDSRIRHFATHRERPHIGQRQPGDDEVDRRNLVRRVRDRTRQRRRGLEEFKSRLVIVVRRMPAQ
jgi:hypothetical protein